MQIEPFQRSQSRLIAKLFLESIEVLGSQAYSAPQRQVWSEFGRDSRLLGERLSQGVTLVMWNDEVPICFGQLHPSDHIDMLYTSPLAARQGCASQIYGRLEELAIKAGNHWITTEASHISRPFFESHGFRALEKETVERGGVSLERFRMEKSLG